MAVPGLRAVPWGTRGGIIHNPGENLIFPPSLGPCSPMANPLQPVTTLADLCPHATSWGQAGHSSGMAREELPTLALVLGESSS